MIFLRIKVVENISIYNFYQNFFFYFYRFKSYVLKNYFIGYVACLLIFVCFCFQIKPSTRANAWFARRNWVLSCNLGPSPPLRRHSTASGKKISQRGAACVTRVAVNASDLATPTALCLRVRTRVAESKDFALCPKDGRSCRLI